MTLEETVMTAKASITTSSFGNGYIILENKS